MGRIIALYDSLPIVYVSGHNFVADSAAVFAVTCYLTEVSLILQQCVFFLQKQFYTCRVDFPFMTEIRSNKLWCNSYVVLLLV